MKLAVISDLHLGSSAETDLFGHDDAEFLRFLRFLEQNFERIVLLGDVWETLTGRSYGDPAAELRLARARHPEIARRFRGPKYRYVHGNHDLIAGSAEGVPERLELYDRGVRILFTHGHQADGLVRSARGLSELGVWLGGWIRRIGLAGVYALGQQFDAWRSGSVSASDDRCVVRRWAFESKSCHDADIVVTGHTHRAVRAERGSRLFLNSGSCAEGCYSFLSLDTRRGDYGVHRGY